MFGYVEFFAYKKRGVEFILEWGLFDVTLA